jgi:hypothetical protein
MAQRDHVPVAVGAWHTPGLDLCAAGAVHGGHTRAELIRMLERAP